MPTFDDPQADAAEASAALRGLAHATRAMPEPAATYSVIGDLLAGVRSLRQVLDQLAAAHVDNRVLAHDDAGDQAAGATSALAAADELHQAGALLDTVERRLDAASQHSGRIAWQPAAPTPEPARTTAHIGTLTLTVWPDEPLGEHQRYAYRIEDSASGETIEGRDLFTGTGAPVDPSRALRELGVDLSAAGEARNYVLDNPGTHPENEGLFPEWAADAALRSYTDLTVFAEFDPAALDAEQAPLTEPALRWISVVFLDGSEADEVLDLIRREGTDAAIEHLAGFDLGEETAQAALENGYVYSTPPTGALDRTATRDIYTLTYNPFTGHIALLREHDALPDPVLLSIETPAPSAASAQAPAAERETARRVGRAGAETDWFARPPVSPSHGRGLVL
ncbi:hypothetical protein [Skermania piniformis]|uniref:Uncharacterized protein n=1 Tax=Skermania pinensis TaxID=39122 RepID=A0ABX8S7R8_9ACTN|nr:hypothetical protein [Skermania piniformis]QXQ13054.1 hypothetical protein KV203_14240 [Skermania piniformis]